MARRPQPRRGEVWTVDLDPVVGHELAGIRPSLVISEDALNLSAAEQVIVIPMTTRNKGIRSHVCVSVGEGGLQRESFIKCEDVRSVSTNRLRQRLGLVSELTLQAVAERLRLLMRL